MATPLANPEPALPVAVAILAKAPIPGLAKTRLIPALGAVGAAALQGWMLQRTVNTVMTAGLGPVFLWCAPDASHPAFQAIGRNQNIDLRQQPDGDLGVRMALALAESGAPGGTLIVGTDCPELAAADLQQAAAALRTHDAVVTSAADGGYVLIGARRSAPELFAAIDWSTERVLTQTRQRLSALAWRHIEFGPLADVDEVADYYRLVELFPAAADFAGGA